MDLYDTYLDRHGADMMFDQLLPVIYRMFRAEFCEIKWFLYCMKFPGLLQARLARLYGEPFRGSGPESTFQDTCPSAYGCLEGLSDTRNGVKLDKPNKKSLIEKWVYEALKKCSKQREKDDSKKQEK